MMLRAILAFLALPAIVAGLAPWLISRIPAPAMRWWPYGVVPLAIGGGMLISSVISFYRRGQGTLAPWDPPKHLVVQDFYRFNRNPMYLGIVTLLLGWALVAGNPWNYAYATLVAVMFHLRVVLYEEREMERLFGQEWVAYRSAVPRWGLRLRPYIPDVKPSDPPNDGPVRIRTALDEAVIGDRSRSHTQMTLTRIDDALVVAAYFRGQDPSAQVWSSNSDQVLTLSLFYTGDISYNDCASRFEHRPYLRCVYDDDGELNARIEQRYKILIDLIQHRPDLIEGGGDLKTPADPTYTACGLTDAGCQLASALKSTFPQKPDFPNWPDGRAFPDLV